VAKNTVRVNVIGDASSLKRSMGEAEKSTQKAGAGFSTFAKIAVAALAVKALGAVKDFVGDSKRAFVDLNESLNAVEVSYGKSAEGIKALGRESATSMGLSNSAFNSFAVSISAFAQQIAGDSGDVVGTVKDLTGRVSDFASVMNLEVADAARLFQSGLAGESEPLRRYGIDVSAATVQTFAYANGIAKAGEELTEAQKVQARYGTIMEQTNKVAGDFANTSGELANKQRIANAQIENSKAIVGQALKGAYEAAIPLTVKLAAATADAAIDFMELTEQISRAEAQVLRFNQATGGSVDNVFDLAKEVDQLTKSFDLWNVLPTDGSEKFNQILSDTNELLIAQASTMDLTALSAQELEHQARSVGEEYGFTTDQTEQFVDMLLFQQKVQSDTGAGDAWLDALLNQGEAVEELAEETEEATTALQDFEAEVRAQTDPLFNLVKKTDELAAAQDAVTAAAKEYKTGSPEHREALRDEYLAWEDLKAAQIRAAEQSGLTKEAFMGDLAATGRFTKAEIDLIIADFERVNAFKFSGKTIDIQVTGGGGAAVIAQAKAKGGPVKRGDPYLVGEEGPEVFVPGQSGQIIPNGSNGGSPLGGGGAGITVIVQGSVLTERDLVDAIYEGLVRKQRRGGMGLVG
jgi:sulfur transfer complex TusBCD TusB component (DsrH family)